ncbi:hypothetical protein J2128_002384 [Methanomicrobium sp. W14]|uniref:DUF5658 family protein n=1 Tax=Methanomicrobium sp. W14 TaxID=2817839 RepID=UPI001AE1E309|nr:DUF5658 family protein [Methanomicrobium sp. W14]MBP2134418.1 hypothetical protein [Methanomicrobium sp. W14]
MNGVIKMEWPIRSPPLYNPGGFSITVAGGLIVLAVLFSLDVATTQFILSNGGYELNIFMKAVAGTEIFHIAVKSAVFAIIAFAVVYSNSRLKNSGTIALAAIILWYAFVFAHNMVSVLAVL